MSDPELPENERDRSEPQEPLESPEPAERIRRRDQLRGQARELAGQVREQAKELARVPGEARELATELARTGGTEAAPVEVASSGCVRAGRVDLPDGAGAGLRVLGGDDG